MHKVCILNGIKLQHIQVPMQTINIMTCRCFFVFRFYSFGFYWLDCNGGIVDSFNILLGNSIKRKKESFSKSNSSNRRSSNKRSINRRSSNKGSSNRKSSSRKSWRKNRKRRRNFKETKSKPNLLVWSYSVLCIHATFYLLIFIYLLSIPLSLYVSLSRSHSFSILFQLNLAIYLAPFQSRSISFSIHEKLNFW